jgi:hypothetical protein
MFYAAHGQSEAEFQLPDPLPNEASIELCEFICCI